jgi:hypothetical protein
MRWRRTSAWPGAHSPLARFDNKQHARRTATACAMRARAPRCQLPSLATQQQACRHWQEVLNNTRHPYAGRHTHAHTHTHTHTAVWLHLDNSNMHTLLQRRRASTTGATLDSNTCLGLQKTAAHAQPRRKVWQSASTQTVALTAACRTRCAAVLLCCCAAAPTHRQGCGRSVQRTDDHDGQQQHWQAPPSASTRTRRRASSLAGSCRPRMACTAAVHKHSKQARRAQPQRAAATRLKYASE